MSVRSQHGGRWTKPPFGFRGRFHSKVGLLATTESGSFACTSRGCQAGRRGRPSGPAAWGPRSPGRRFRRRHRSSRNRSQRRRHIRNQRQRRNRSHSRCHIRSPYRSRKTNRSTVSGRTGSPKGSGGNASCNRCCSPSCIRSRRSRHSRSPARPRNRSLRRRRSLRRHRIRSSTCSRSRGHSDGRRRASPTAAGGTAACSSRCRNHCRSRTHWHSRSLRPRHIHNSVRRLHHIRPQPRIHSLVRPRHRTAFRNKPVRHRAHIRTRSPAYGPAARSRSFGCKHRRRRRALR